MWAHRVGGIEKKLVSPLITPTIKGLDPRLAIAKEPLNLTDFLACIVTVAAVLQEAAGVLHAGEFIKADLSITSAAVVLLVVVGRLLRKL